jgi:hypothetical protein
MPGYCVLPILACFLLAVNPTARATPITYAFSGDLNQPIDGSTQFSGTLTTERAIAIGGGNGWAIELSVPNQVTLSFGDHSVSITSGATGREISSDYYHNSTINGNVGDTFKVIMDASSAVNGLDPALYGSGLHVSLSMTDPAGDVYPNTSPLLTLPTILLANFPQISVSITLQTDPSVTVTGTLTSFAPAGDSAPVPAPESGTLAIFALLGVGGMAYNRCVRA